MTNGKILGTLYENTSIISISSQLRYFDVIVRRIILSFWHGNAEGIIVVVVKLHTSSVDQLWVTKIRPVGSVASISTGKNMNEHEWTG